MKGKRHIQSFNEHQENLNISDVSESKSYSEEEVIQLLIKFNQEIYEIEDVRDWFERFKKK